MKKDQKTFTVTCSMSSRWVPHFLSMLNYMEVLGSVGSSRKVTLYCDGDGDFRPKFKFDLENLNFVEPVKDDDGDHVYDAG
jgi:hypothetical protein